MQLLRYIVKYLLLLGFVFISCKNEKDKSVFFIAAYLANLNVTSTGNNSTEIPKCTGISSWTSRTVDELNS
jgi:hypothetical protein